MKDLWNVQEGLLLQPFELGHRFGLARDRFVSWRKYLKLRPAEEGADKAWKISPFIRAFNNKRREVFKVGSGAVIDESMSHCTLNLITCLIRSRGSSILYANLSRWGGGSRTLLVCPRGLWFTSNFR